MPVEVCNYSRSTLGGGKFVVLVPNADAAGGLVLFSDFSRDFQHRDIVRRWETAAGRTVSQAGLRVRGGGWWKMESDCLVLYGRSAAYGRFDPAWLAAALRPGMFGTEARIEVR